MPLTRVEGGGSVSPGLSETSSFTLPSNVPSGLSGVNDHRNCPVAVRFYPLNTVDPIYSLALLYKIFLYLEIDGMDLVRETVTYQFVRLGNIRKMQCVQKTVGIH